MSSVGADRTLTKQRGESARQSIRVGMIVKRLQDHIDGKADMSATQQAAAKTLLDRALPTLTATELTTHEEIPAESNILASIAALLSRNPALKQALASQLNADLARAAPGVQSVDLNQDSTKAA